MRSNLFQPEAKIIPEGLQYLIRKYDYDYFVKKVTFCGVELIFDSPTNLTKFRDQFYKLNKPQLQVFFSSQKKIGHLLNQHDSFCNLQIRINSPLYFLSGKDDPYPVIGEMIYEELAKHVELANVTVKDFDFHHGIFLEEDVPEDLLCPISLELMEDPITVSSKQTYDRSSLVQLFKHKNNPKELPCPLTRLMINADELSSTKTNVTVKNLIDEYKKEKQGSSRNFNRS